MKAQVNLIRDTDKMVFGELRSARITSIKPYIIKNGEVKIKYCNKLWTIEEHRENRESFSFPYVQIANWSEHSNY